MTLETCIHCGKVLHREIHDGHTFLIDDETGGDVCGTWGTYGNEPHVSDQVRRRDDTLTHFATSDASKHTLCGQRWHGIVMNDRPATCRVCSDEHAAKGWTFPLPDTVVL